MSEPMGTDEVVPTFSGDPDFFEQADEMLAGFGTDSCPSPLPGLEPDQ
jgi:hypothetical protein